MNTGGIKKSQRRLLQTPANCWTFPMEDSYFRTSTDSHPCQARPCLPMGLRAILIRVFMYYLHWSPYILYCMWGPRLHITGALQIITTYFFE
jgi:hypothetical protein